VQPILRRFGQRTPRTWGDTDLTRLGPELRPVIDRVTGFVLPLVHHLMKQRVTRLLPPDAANVAPAQRDLRRLAVRGAGVVSEAAPHAPRDAKRDRFEPAVKMLDVVARMPSRELRHHGAVLRPGARTTHCR